MQTALSWIWTWFAVSISCNDNHYTTSPSYYICMYACEYMYRVQKHNNKWLFYKSRLILKSKQQNKKIDSKQ